jgi:D-amino-acid dehydrogenase
MRVTVLGGGLMGVTTAWYLARAGHDVSVIERAPGLAEGTSFANAGLIAPSDSGPWNSPGTLGRLLKYLGREDSPLLLRPGAVPAMAGWGLRFLWQSRAGSFARNTEANTRLAIYNLTLLKALRSEFGIPYDETTGGLLQVFAETGAFDAAARGSERLKAFSLSAEILDPGAAMAREPALKGGETLAGALYFPGDESGDAHAFTRALGECCKAAGVNFRFGETILGFDIDGGKIKGVRTNRRITTADAVVIALGTWSSTMVRGIGARLPIYPVKGYSATIDTEGWNAAPRLPVIHDTLKVAASPMGQRLRAAGTAEFAGFNTKLNPVRAQAVLRAAKSLFPGLSDYAEDYRVRYWTGLRPMTPDGRPLIGRLKLPNLYVNAGHGGLGWTLACGSGRLAADLVAGNTPEIDPAPFSPDR